jgi:hypothetical protein
MEIPEFIPTPEQIRIAEYSHKRWMLNHFYSRCYTAYQWAVTCLQNEWVQGYKVKW